MMKNSETSVVSNWIGTIKFQCLFVALVLFQALPVRAVDTFVPPIKEELAMTSQAGYPGAAAVILYREEVADDDRKVVQHYERIKVLTEEGKKYANVEIRIGSATDEDSLISEQKAVEDVSGRTIHKDGTIVPFKGMPYQKTLEKVDAFSVTSSMTGRDYQESYEIKATVFTLPDVQVGDVLEYRYATRWAREYVDPPWWFIQGPLYVRTAHLVWHPTVRNVRYVSWFTTFPADAIQHHGAPIGMQDTYEVNVHDVPPLPSEELSPPLESLSGRVLFNYSSYANIPEFWKSEGKDWAKTADTFAGPDSELTAATKSLTEGAPSQDAALRKIYATIMSLENTDYTRERARREDKAAGNGKLDHASGILQRKYGTSAELAELFAGMARAAGMKAFLMAVPDRSHRQFNREWLNFNQLDGTLVVVTVDGKDIYFDPGSRYCPYASLSWQHTAVEGLLESPKGPVFSTTPAQTYGDNKTVHGANLTINENGAITGTINLLFNGAPALYWRQKSLEGDDESLKHSLKTSLERMLPKSMEVEVANIKNLTDYEKPLQVDYSVTGSPVEVMGKRLLLPADIFVSQSPATFTGEKRETPVYFHYPQTILDALRMTYPPDLEIEASPASLKSEIKGAAAYSFQVVPAAHSVTVRRDYLFDKTIVPTTEYPELRSFYSQFEAKDHEELVLRKTAGDATSKPAGAQ